MPKLFDRVKVNIPTTGTGTVTFGAVPSNAFLTPAESGAIDADTVRYLLIDGTDFEEGVGTIQSSIAQMARTTVTRSKIAGVYGSSKINLSGTATLVFTASAADILNPANNLSDVASVATARTSLGATATGVALFTANNAAAGRTALGSTTVGDAVFVASDAATARAAMEAAPFFAADSSVININGGMEVSQENVGNAVTLTGTGTLQFKHLIDGAVAGYRGTFVASAQQVAAPSGMPAVKALKITVGTAQGSLGANDELTVMFPVEGYRASRLLFGTSSASALGIGFWFSAHRTGNYSGAIMNSAKTRSYPFSFSVAAADTPQWVSLSGASAIAGDTSGTWLKDTGVGLYVAICLAGGSSRVGTASAWATTSSPGTVGVTGTTNGVAATSDVFHISNVIALPGIELPAGARAPLAIRSAAHEIELCRRYFQKTFPDATAVATGAGYGGAIMYQATRAGANPWFFPVPFAAMCAAPTVTFYNPTSANAKWYNASASADSGDATPYYGANQQVVLGNPQVSGDAISNLIFIHATFDARLI